MGAIAISGDSGSALGIYDPSIVAPPGTSTILMSYSSVPAQNQVFTRLAASTDLGATFNYVVDINAPAPLSIPCSAGICSGSLVHEVSSLVADPDDPDASRRYKVFTHSYMVIGQNTLHYEYGQLSLFTAPMPTGPWSPRSGVIGWSSDSSFSSQGAAMLTSQIPQLADCVALTEPGALIRPGASLDLAVGCVFPQSGAGQIRIELLRSVDHGATFQYVARLLDPDEARCLGSSYNHFNAADLFTAGGNEYLLASPEDNTGYRGCVVVQVVDPVTGTLSRTATGALNPTRILGPAGTRPTGACAYAEGASAAGYLAEVGFFDQPPPLFRMFKTGITAP